MTLTPFKLERYFAKYEFKSKYLLSPSDCESLGMSELLAMADNECLDLWNHLQLGYTESSGHPLLRSEIARLDAEISAENILVAAPEEAIFIAMQTLLNPGDQVIAIAPAYQSLYELARSIGCEVIPWHLYPHGQEWRVDLSFLEQHITSKTRMLVINFPHNPTGSLISQPEQEKIVDLARRNNIYLFSDEMYRLLEYDTGQRLPPVYSLYEKGISLAGLSKSFALPGLRIGWLMTQDKTAVEGFQLFKDYTTICSSAPSEILGIIALRARESILARNLDRIATNIRAANEFCERYPGSFLWMKPMAGSVAFPQWTGRVPVDDFCRQALDQKSVMIVPGSIFDYAGSHFRVGLGRKNLPEALDQVSDFLDHAGKALLS